MTLLHVEISFYVDRNSRAVSGQGFSLGQYGNISTGN